MADVVILHEPMNTDSIIVAAVSGEAALAIVEVENELLGGGREGVSDCGDRVDEEHGLGGIVHEGEPAAGRAADDLVPG